MGGVVLGSGLISFFSGSSFKLNGKRKNLFFYLWNKTESKQLGALAKKIFFQKICKF